MKSEEVNPLDEVINGIIHIYSYKFPNNTIYVGHTTYGLERRDNDHRGCSVSPIFYLLKEYPFIKPKLEIITMNTTLKNIYIIERGILHANPNMKILNGNLWLFGY